jgi:hypothetical protein
MMERAALSPAAAAGLFPDPVLSASVYVAGRLCEVVDRLVAPFWERYRERSSAPGSYVWFMRYARCGEHLKIRVHAPESEVPLLRELLLAAQADYFAHLAPPPPGLQRLSTPAATPVDAEDRATVDYPDRTFLWTGYGRSHLSLGYRPYLGDDRYAGLFTRCLGSGAEIVLGRLASGPDGECPFALQREIWLDALLAGLQAVPLSARDRALYLLYHRDCLLRYYRKKKRWVAGASAMAQVIARFDEQAERLEETRRELAAAVTESWSAIPLPRRGEGLEAWRESLRELVEYVSPLLGDPAYHVDPFADRAVFSVLFKAFHGVANQIGLDAYNEAFLHHSLLDVGGESDLRRRPVRLKPEL